MKIQPLGKVIQLEIEEAKAGILDTSSRKSAVEFAKVISVGEEVDGIEVGDQIFAKAWAIDIITHNDKNYYFINIETNGILAIVK